MSLVELADGSRAVVSGIEGGRHFRKKLMDLGIIPGMPVTVVRKAGRNPMVLAVMGRQVVLGRGMAEKVFVR